MALILCNMYVLCCNAEQNVSFVNELEKEQDRCLNRYPMPGFSKLRSADPWGSITTAQGVREDVTKNKKVLYFVVAIPMAFYSSLQPHPSH